MTFVPLGVPIIREINNGILKSANAMPMKDINSDGDSSFSLGRLLYKQTEIKPVNVSTIKIGKMIIQRSALGLGDHQTMINGPATPLQKRWIGGNHDASQIIANRRIRAMGKGTFNAAGTKTSFNDVIDRNAQRQALTRTRHIGSIAPAKKIHKYANAPVFY